MAGPNRRALLPVGGSPVDLRWPLLELEPRGSDRRQALTPIASQAATKKSAQGDPDPCRKGRQIGLVLQHRGQRLGHVATLEGAPPAQRLEQAHSERPDVGAAVGRLPPGLLRRHVGGGAQQRARLSRAQRQGGGVRQLGTGLRARGAVGISGPRQAEVEDLHLPLGGDHHIRRLEVAMDQAAIVGRFEAARDLVKQVDGPVDRQWAALQNLGQCFALDQFHDQEAGRLTVDVSLFEAIEGRHVRVLQCRQCFGLALEAGHPLGVVRHLRWQHLDRHPTIHPRVTRCPHLSHAALAERGFDFVGAELGLRLQWHSGVLSFGGEDSATGSTAKVPWQRYRSRPHPAERRPHPAS